MKHVTALCRNFSYFLFASLASLPTHGCLSSNIPTSCEAARHQMSLRVLATPLAFLLIISGFAVAQISAPDCNSTLDSEWAWVCILSSLQCILWSLPDLMAFSSSHTILATKLRVWSQRTCCRHATKAVSRLLDCFALAALHW